MDSSVAPKVSPANRMASREEGVHDERVVSRTMSDARSIACSSRL